MSSVNNYKSIYLLCCFLTIIALYTAIKASLSVPEFLSLYEGFGAELPAATKLVVKYHFIGLIFPVVAVICCLYIAIAWSKINFKTYFVIILVAYAISELWREFFITAMYAPIMQMGKVVGGV